MENNPEQKLEKLVRRELGTLPDRPAPSSLIPQVLSAVTLEQVVQRQLKALPERPAPATLIPRVLSAIEARNHRRWWRQPLLSWPIPARVPAVALACALAGLLIYCGFAIQESAAVGSVVQRIGGWFAFLSPLLDVLLTLGNALLVLAKAGQPYLILGVSLVFAMYLACVGLGTACFRLALTQKSI